MSWGTPSTVTPATQTETRLPAGDDFASEAAAAGYLLVELPPPRPNVRGRLSLFVDGAIERTLEARGAPPPGGIDAPCTITLSAALADQLHRAQVTGAGGLAIWVSPLAEIATGSGTLDCDDSAVLRWWLAAAADQPVMLGFDPANHPIGVYFEPRTLASILAQTATRAPEEVDPPSDGVESAHAEVAPVAEAAAPETAETADEPIAASPRAEVVPEAAPASDIEDPEALLAESARAMAADLPKDEGTDWLREALIELSTPPPRAALTDSRDTNPPSACESPDADDFWRIPAAAPAPKLDLRFADDVLPGAEEAPVPEAPRPEVDVETRTRLEGYARELQSANGPKPLAVVERLFTSAYSPLRRALDRGADLPRLREVADEWARSFEKSYTDAFDALRVRTKRPAMVVDVADAALRIGRLHGARSTQLLLVDALRHDLGETVNERLGGFVGRRAACAERLLLWAALPTTTAAQVELIGRGPSGLRDFTGEIGDDLVVARGRKAPMIRRLKTGHREILKLDLVAARLSEPLPLLPGDLDTLADETAQRLAAHFEGLQPRTLVMVFGDHGFRVDAGDGRGRPEIREGGASPEEVLVPAYAWLVGAVH